jgi:hypothetical protein
MLTEQKSCLPSYPRLRQASFSAEKLQAFQAVKQEPDMPAKLLRTRTLELRNQVVPFAHTVPSYNI